MGLRSRVARERRGGRRRGAREAAGGGVQGSGGCEGRSEHTECSVSPRTLGTKRVPRLAAAARPRRPRRRRRRPDAPRLRASRPSRDPPGHQLAGLARSKDAAAEPASHLLRLQQHRRASACSQPPHEAFLPAATPPALPSVRASGPALAPLGSLGSEALPHESRHSAGRYAARKPRMVASTHAIPVASPHDAPAQVVGQAASGFNLGASMISRLRFNRQKRQEGVT